MDDSLIPKRKAAAVMKTVHEQLADTIAELGWDCYDNVAVEIGGTQVSGIHQPENYNKNGQHLMVLASTIKMRSLLSKILIVILQYLLFLTLTLRHIISRPRKNLLLNLKGQMMQKCTKLTASKNGKPD